MRSGLHHHTVFGNDIRESKRERYRLGCHYTVVEYVRIHPSNIKVGLFEAEIHLGLEYTQIKSEQVYT